MNRIVDASEVIRKQIPYNVGIFAGDHGKFADFAVKSAESRWESLFKALKHFDFLPNAQVWAACGVASVLQNEIKPGELFTGPKFAVGYDFSLTLLCKLLDDIDFDFRLKSTLSNIEAELLSEAAKIRDNAFQNMS